MIETAHKVSNQSSAKPKEDILSQSLVNFMKPDVITLQDKWKIQLTNTYKYRYHNHIRGSYLNSINNQDVKYHLALHLPYYTDISHMHKK